MSLRLYKLEAKVQALARRLDALEQRAPRRRPARPRQR